ncbi:hypothetical protein CC78DRAFT_533031 [Lojkania enalia]|uniref:Uncharacterized protein n=1 Tax=Lojkania enalia TaxID=147567 RepID=A0A9P4KAF0_9PLEO|nr:hypothetical protein CC78DRAFT_533031 [Didymosphaeria enalia]
MVSSTRRTRRTQHFEPNKRRRTTATVCWTGLCTPEPSKLPESQLSSGVNASQPEQKKPQHERDVFPFMQLPAELRVHIYRMALQRDTPLFLHLPRPPNVESDDDAPRPPTRTCIVTSVGIVRPSPSLDIGRELEEAEEIAVRRVHADPLVPTLLRISSAVYKEARQVLYAENTFILQLDSGLHTLNNMHQRSRSMIKHVSLTIPSHHDILDSFADLVRLGLRYCWGLKTLTIRLPGGFPDDRFMSGTTSVYANAFHILRWLPKACKVSLEGSVNEQIRRVAEDEGRLQSVLDEKSYLKRQHQMPERH